MRTIVIAGGKGERWNNHLGVRKHLAPLPNGQTILDRIIKQFEPDLIITKGVESKDFLDIQKVACTIPYWSDTGRTLIVLGDVYFTDEAVKEIKEGHDEDWLMYGRLTKSNVKRKHASNENFAFSFYPQAQARIFDAMYHSTDLVRMRDIRWNKMAQLYRILCGKDGREADLQQMPQEDLGNFVTINDLTDDIDYPEDYEDLIKALR